MDLFSGGLCYTLVYKIFELEQRYEWKRQHLKMYVALNMRDFHCHLSSREGVFLGSVILPVSSPKGRNLTYLISDRSRYDIKTIHLDCTGRFNLMPREVFETQFS